MHYELGRTIPLKDAVREEARRKSAGEERGGRPACCRGAMDGERSLPGQGRQPEAKRAGQRREDDEWPCASEIRCNLSSARGLVGILLTFVLNVAQRQSELIYVVSSSVYCGEIK